VGSRRQLFITIDGDGFIYRHRTSGRPVGELIHDHVLTAYPFEFTASFIAEDLERYRDRFDVELARTILALDNVEAASHSWSHPGDWTTPEVDLEHEIIDSVRFLEQRLLPTDQRVELFFWTGRCNPTEEALRIVDGLGIGNLNGGDMQSAFTTVGQHRHYHSRAWNDWTGMDLARCHAGGGTAETFLPTAPGSLDGFARVTEFFEAHPSLPVHVYFHWYSGVREDSLDALRRVLDWCLAHDLDSVPASQYVAALR